MDQVDLDVGIMISGNKTDAGRGRIVVINEAILPYVRSFMARATGQLLLSGYSGSLLRSNFYHRD